ncbi:ribonuclease H-like domain-containing protein, partial [Hysterangium stoloniferum]
IEYRPSFIKGQPLHKTALVQLASASIALLVQVSAMSQFPNSIKAILQNPAIIKVGVGIQGDVKKLRDDYGVNMNGSLELGYLARAVDPQWSASRGLISLARLAKAYQGIDFKKLKRVQMSNWELMLTEEQQDYAANDAFIALTIFDKLNIILPTVRPSPAKETYIF